MSFLIKILAWFIAFLHLFGGSKKLTKTESLHRCANNDEVVREIEGKFLFTINYSPDTITEADVKAVSITNKEVYAEFQKQFDDFKAVSDAYVESSKKI